MEFRFISSFYKKYNPPGGTRHKVVLGAISNAPHINGFKWFNPIRQLQPSVQIGVSQSLSVELHLSSQRLLRWPSSLPAFMRIKKAVLVAVCKLVSVGGTGITLG